MNRVFGLLVSALLVGPSMATAHVPLQAQGQVEVLASLNLMRALNLPVLAKSERIGVGYAVLTPEMQQRLSAMNHANGRCAGFEVLSPSRMPGLEGQVRELQNLERRVEADRRWSSFMPRRMEVPHRADIQAAMDDLREENLRAFVTWASSHPDRYNRSSDPNVAVRGLVQKLQGMLAPLRRFNSNIQIELVNHTSTKQQSVRVRIVGKSRPNEIVVIGGHFDSINQGWGSRAAPGADDNASGSANVFEALRVVAARGPADRTLEFYWYAGEESGLLGSAEIAKAYKQQNRQVVAVLQLDMTSFPGSGEFVVGNVGDYTSAWLRDFLVGVNDTYLKVKLIPDECGYACSDHASWYRQGYPTLMPFEATTRTMNRRIHTADDVIFAQTSFKHSMVFSKIAVAFAMEIGNSAMVQPYQ